MAQVCEVEGYIAQVCEIEGYMAQVCERLKVTYDTNEITRQYHFVPCEKV